MYAPRGREGGQASYTFLLRISKKGGGGPDSMLNTYVINGRSLTMPGLSAALYPESCSIYGGLDGGGGGPQIPCRIFKTALSHVIGTKKMILSPRKGPVAVSNFRNDHVALSILGV